MPTITKPVRCIETGEVFATMAAAGASIGQLYNGIHQRVTSMYSGIDGIQRESIR